MVGSPTPVTGCCSVPAQNFESALRMHSAYAGADGGRLGIPAPRPSQPATPPGGREGRARPSSPALPRLRALT